MSNLGNVLFRMLATGDPGDGIPIEELLQFISFPIVIGFLVMTFFSMYYLGEPRGRSRFGLSGNAMTAVKHTSLNFLIVTFGAIFFTFLIWQMYYPIPYWGDQAILATAFGLLLGIAFGFMTFYVLYRRR